MKGQFFEGPSREEVTPSPEKVGEQVEACLKPMLESYFGRIRGIDFLSTEKGSREDLEGVDGWFIIGENGALRIPIDLTCKSKGEALKGKERIVMERNQRNQELTPLAGRIILVPLPSWLQEKILSIPLGGEVEEGKKKAIVRATTTVFLKELGYIDPEAFEQAAKILKQIYKTA